MNASVLRAIFIAGLIAFALSIRSQNLSARVHLGVEMRSDEAIDWSRSLKSQIECRLLRDLGGAYLCLTTNQALLRDLLGRAAYYAENSGKERKVMGEDESAYLGSEQARYVGHAIRGTDLLEFMAEADQACAASGALCMNPLETSLRDTVVADARRRGFRKFTVLAATVSANPIEPVISHIVLQARFFRDLEYRQAVKRFWSDQVAERDKAHIIEIIRATYDMKHVAGTEQELVLLNRVQAHLLQNEAENSQLYLYAGKYSQSLRDSLAGHLPGAN